MNLVVGVGLRAGTSYRELRDLVADALSEAGAGTVRYVVTVAGRETEPGLQRLAASLDAELQTAVPDELARQPVPTPSQAVEQLTGTPSVAEAAVLATGAELLVPKRRSPRATAAVGHLCVEAVELGVEIGRDSAPACGVKCVDEPGGMAHSSP